MSPNLDYKTMFTKYPTSKCEFFVWGRSHSPEPAPVITEQVIAVSRPWSYGAPEQTVPGPDVRTEVGGLTCHEAHRQTGSGHFGLNRAETGRNRGEPWPTNHNHRRNNAAF